MQTLHQQKSLLNLVSLDFVRKYKYRKNKLGKNYFGKRRNVNTMQIISISQSAQNLKCSTFWWRQSFSVGFNCSEEGRPPSVIEKSQSASSSPQGPRRNWASPSHSIHGSEPHRKHSELLRRTSTASGTKTQDCTSNCLFSAVHSYRLGFYFLFFSFLHCICSSIEKNAKIIIFFSRQNHCTVFLKTCSC